MKYYRKKSHTIYDNKYHHLAWITKYRKKVLVGDIGYKLRDIVRQICEELQVEIIKGKY